MGSSGFPCVRDPAQMFVTVIYITVLAHLKPTNLTRGGAGGVGEPKVPTKVSFQSVFSSAYRKLSERLPDLLLLSLPESPMSSTLLSLPLTSRRLPLGALLRVASPRAICVAKRTAASSWVPSHFDLSGSRFLMLSMWTSLHQMREPRGQVRRDLPNSSCGRKCLPTTDK